MNERVGSAAQAVSRGPAKPDGSAASFSAAANALSRIGLASGPPGSGGGLRAQPAATSAKVAKSTQPATAGIGQGGASCGMSAIRMVLSWCVLASW